MVATRTRTLLATAVLVAVVTAACGGADDAGEDMSAGSSPATAGWIGAEGPLDWVSDGAGLSGEEGLAAATAEAEAGGRVMVDAAEAASPAADDVAVEPPIDTALRAGSVDDNEAWEDYLLYRQDMLAAGIAVNDVDVTPRQILRVVDPAGNPVLGATVEIVTDGGDTVARRVTYADGRMMFFAPRSGGEQDPSPQLTARAQRGDAATEAVLSTESLQHEIVLDVPPAAQPVPLDILFLLDATGSMGDEIEQLKANMISVSERVDELDPRPDVRFAMTVYRDEGDVFLTRTFDFTADVATFADALRDVVADGGGDYAEALDLGLHDSLAAPTWRGDDAVKLVFLVADAPPHLGDGLERSDADYVVEAATAADRGVKIHPVASSGLDDQGEYVMRQIAQLSFGRFNFLTYGADGIEPGDSTTHHVDDYSVLSLDDLVVQLVADELAPLAATETGSGE